MKVDNILSISSNFMSRLIVSTIRKCEPGSPRLPRIRGPSLQNRAIFLLEHPFGVLLNIIASLSYPVLSSCLIAQRILPLDLYLKSDTPFGAGANFVDDPADMGILLGRSGPLFHGAVRAFHFIGEKGRLLETLPSVDGKGDFRACAKGAAGEIDRPLGIGSSRTAPVAASSPEFM